MIEFGSNKEMRWIAWPEGVQLTVMADGRRINCFVARTYIEDRFDHPGAAEACLAAAKEHFDEITDQLGNLIAGGRFESDGRIILKTGGPS